MNREQAAGQALLGPEGLGRQVPACGAQPGGEPGPGVLLGVGGAHTARSSGATHEETLGAQAPVMKERVCVRV